MYQQPYHQNNFPFQKEHQAIVFQQQKNITQQGRPNQWAVPNDGKVREQNGIRQLNQNNPSTNVLELSQDLMKLKQQLKKLAERGEQIGANRVKAEEVQSGRLKVQPTNPNYFRPNLSADQHALRRNPVNGTLIYQPQMPNPSQTVPQNPKLVQDPVKQNEEEQVGKPIDLPPSKRQKIYSFMQNKQSRGRGLALNSKQPQKQNEGQSNRINVQLRLELQIKQLKQKLTKIQNQLKVSNEQKEQLTLKLNNIKQNNSALKEQLDKSQRQSSVFEQSYSPQVYEQEQKKANAIIEKLQAQIQNLKSSNRVSFDEALKSQLQQNKILKVKLDEKTQQLQQIKDNWNIQKKTNESLKSELSLQQMKASTELRGRQRKLQIQLNDKANELQTAKRALETLELKYKASLNQIREKDDFIMNYMVGRAKENQKQEIKKVLAQYQIIFPQNRAMNDLLKQQKELQELRKQVQRLRGY